MTRRNRTADVSPPVVQAIFDPAGNICVSAKAPSGNEYKIAPRESFQIAAEDVDWFFHEWNWEHRQRLSRAEEYQPRQLQFNNGRQIEARPDRPQFENGSASHESRGEETVQATFDCTDCVTESEPAIISPEPVEEPESEAPSIEPDPVVETDGGETDQDKE